MRDNQFIDPAQVKHRVTFLTKAIKGAALSAVLFSVACAPEAEEASKPAPRPIKLIVVEESGNEFPVSFPAIVEASQSSVLTFQVGGLLQELPIVEGQQMERGALIGKLDQRDFLNNLNSARAEFENAETEFQRARRLAEQDAIAKSVLDQRRSQRDIARSALDSAQKAYEDTELRAPFDGGIAQVHIENFQNVAAQQAIVTLQSGGDVEAVVDVPARLIAHAPEFEPVGTTMTLDAAPDVAIDAAFKEASGRSDPTTQTYRVSFTFTPPENLLVLPGMAGRLDSRFVYQGDDVEFGVAVPPGAIMSDGDNRYVWVVDETSMIVSKRLVTIGRERLAEEVYVVAGLEDGEVIAGAGASYLVDGMEVRAWEGAER